MSKIFISYARKHEIFARRLATSLSDAGADIWLDVEDIPAGMNWSSAIQQGLDSCEAILVIITPESMASKNVENEWQYYLDESKPIIPILLELAKVHFQLRRIQYIDFLNQSYDTAFEELHSELQRKGIALNPISASDSSVELPYRPPLPERETETPFAPPAKPEVRSNRSLLLGGIAAIAGLIILGLVIARSGILNPQPTTIPTQQSAAQVTTVAPTNEPTQTPSDTPTITLTPTPSETPDFIVLAMTFEVDQTQTQIAVDKNVTATESVAATGTAMLWTPTLTPNVTASFEAFLTERANLTLTAVAESWTDTPTPTSSNTPTLTPTSTLTVLEAALQHAHAGVTRNNDWQKFIWPDEQGVDMVLVPVGQFIMGSEGIYEEERRGAHTQEFLVPFWIDRTEVTRAMYAQFVAAQTPTETPPTSPRSTRDEQPINNVKWNQARDYCAWRGARLPTEREWEYAARGPDNLKYPWGPDFIGDNVVYADNSNGLTADVGSKSGESGKPDGTSWVGAVDMSGNVWEWTSSLFMPYPYNVDSPPESDADTSSLRVLRGGAFDNLPVVVRAGARIGKDPNEVNYVYGFRCARSL